MTITEKIELVMIPVSGGSVFLLAGELPVNVGVGQLLLWASALLLFQGLMRDLFLLARQKRTNRPGPRREARCMCVESTAGVIGIVVGLVMIGAATDRKVVLDRWTWSLLAMGSMAVGFAIKDYVVEWRPWRVRREPDHLNVIVRWK